MNAPVDANLQTSGAVHLNCIDISLYVGKTFLIKAEIVFGE